jgi:hypothetical protein
MFCKWYPTVNSFEAKPLKNNMDILNQNNYIIQNELDRESTASRVKTHFTVYNSSWMNIRNLLILFLII